MAHQPPIEAEQHPLLSAHTQHLAISEKELKLIANIRLPENSSIALARDIFMFSFFMRGMPFVDIAYLRKTDLKNGMWTYCRRKTNQCLKVEWEKAQQNIIDRYSRQTADSPYLFPIILKEDGTEYQQYQRMQININRALKRLGKMAGLKMPLTTYVARHTWASVARDMNIPISIISEGMGHNSIKTTQVYLNSIDTSRINKANKRIIKRIGKPSYQGMIRSFQGMKRSYHGMIRPYQGTGQSYISRYRH